jgi:hypothetical protein
MTAPRVVLRLLRIVALFGSLGEERMRGIG